jgi:hypothetical protein
MVDSAIYPDGYGEKTPTTAGGSLKLTAMSETLELSGIFVFNLNLY